MTTTLFLVVVLGIGYLLSVLIRSQVGASQIALLVTMLPTTLLSGYVFPIDRMPDHPGPHLSGLFPLLRDDHQGGISQGRRHAALPTPILFLLVYAAAVMTLAARAFRKSLD